MFQSSMPQTIDQADLRLRGEASCRYPGKVKRRIGRGQLDDDQRGVAKAGAELGDDVDPRGPPDRLHIAPGQWDVLLVARAIWADRPAGGKRSTR